MMCVFSKRLYPYASVECLICSGGDEDCIHLFWVPLCQDDLDQIINPLSGHVFGDVPMGLNSEGRHRRKMGGAY